MYYIKMENLIELMQHNLVITKNTYVLHDVNYILWGFENSIPQLDPSLYKVKRNMYQSYQELYDVIVNILREKNQIENMLEIMPLIDDYIEYIINIM